MTTVQNFTVDLLTFGQGQQFTSFVYGMHVCRNYQQSKPAANAIDYWMCGRAPAIMHQSGRPLAIPQPKRFMLASVLLYNVGSTICSRLATNVATACCMLAWQQPFLLVICQKPAVAIIVSAACMCTQDTKENVYSRCQAITVTELANLSMPPNPPVYTAKGGGLLNSSCQVHPGVHAGRFSWLTLQEKI